MFLDLMRISSVTIGAFLDVKHNVDLVTDVVSDGPLFGLVIE